MLIFQRCTVFKGSQDLLPFFYFQNGTHTAWSCIDSALAIIAHRVWFCTVMCVKNTIKNLKEKNTALSGTPCCVWHYARSHSFELSNMHDLNNKRHSCAIKTKSTVCISILQRWVRKSNIFSQCTVEFCCQNIFFCRPLL